MENAQNTQINFKSTLINTELSEKLVKFKLFSEFLANSVIYYYQTTHSTKNFTQEELDIIKDKYSQVKNIMDETVVLFQKDLDGKKVN